MSVYEREGVRLPLYDICKVCFNRSTDLCEECCAGQECREFALNPRVSYEDLPLFDINDFLVLYPPRVRQVVVGVYIKLLTDLIGGNNGHNFNHP